MNSLRTAFKEWAVVCSCLAEGKSALILRKGGISEAHGEFRVEHTRFWLFPTWAHQQEAAVVEGCRPLLARVKADRPPEGTIRLTHFALVPCVYHIDDLAKAWKLAGLHCWSQETVEARFEYRTPGLYALPVRVYRAASAVELPETPYHAGCKSWVDLGQDLSTEGASPVLTEEAFDAIVNAVDRILEPTALA
jgi:hypothetical protein